MFKLIIVEEEVQILICYIQYFHASSVKRLGYKLTVTICFWALADSVVSCSYLEFLHFFFYLNPCIKLSTHLIYSSASLYHLIIQIMPTSFYWIFLQLWLSCYLIMTYHYARPDHKETLLLSLLQLQKDTLLLFRSYCQRIQAC